MADTAEAPSVPPAASAPLTPLFSAILEFTSDSPVDAVVPPEGRDGAFIGSGRGRVAGDRVRGTLSWSLYAGDCLYPRIRKGERVSDDLHLCTLNPGRYIEIEDGRRIRFDGRGYGLGSPNWYRVSAILTFATDSAAHHWLTEVLALRRPSSSLCSSMKWFPLPSVANSIAPSLRRIASKRG
jgi:hypothetical protein